MRRRIKVRTEQKDYKKVYAEENGEVNAAKWRMTKKYKA